jgi:hypothetical protein
MRGATQAQATPKGTSSRVQSVGLAQYEHLGSMIGAISEGIA